MKGLLGFLLLISFATSAQFVPTSGSFKTLSDLQTQKGTPWNSVTVLGKDSVNDRGSSTYYWNDTATTAVDNKYVVSVTGVSTGRWIRVYNRYFACKKGINLMATGATLIDVTGPALLGKLIITNAYVAINSVTGTQILAGISSLGTNATSYNNISSSLSLGALTVNTGLIFSMLQAAPLIPAGTSIYFNEITLPTGLSAATADIYLSGYYTL